MVVVGVIPLYSALRDRTDSRVDEVPTNVGLRALLNRVLIVVVLPEGAHYLNDEIGMLLSFKSSKTTTV